MAKRVGSKYRVSSGSIDLNRIYASSFKYFKTLQAAKKFASNRPYSITGNLYKLTKNGEWKYLSRPGL